jgi:hypothetical protein
MRGRAYNHGVVAAISEVAAMTDLQRLLAEHALRITYRRERGLESTP